MDCSSDTDSSEFNDDTEVRGTLNTVEITDASATDTASTNEGNVGHLEASTN